MKKLTQRLLMFIVGLPLVILMVIFLPHRNHLAINICVVMVSALGAFEFSLMLKKKGFQIHPAEAMILGIAGPAAMTLLVSFKVEASIFPVSFILGASWCLIANIFSRDNFEGTINRILAGFAVMFYPGIFILWIIGMTLFVHADKIILMFLLMVFANDSVAWAVGMLFGRGNRGIIPASPNKSVAGFAGGLIAAALAGLAAVFFIPEAFIPSRLPPAAAGILIGLTTGIAAAAGDLAESAMKRSADIKDSGFLIPGRGGVLDTVDSIALAAPVYFTIYWILF
jgi:phosphatidate cytidylyltransferase